MRIFWTGLACLFMALGIVGAIALVNMVIPFINDPALDRINFLLAIIYMLLGVCSFLFWRGFQHPKGTGLWARLARASKANW